MGANKIRPVLYCMYVCLFVYYFEQQTAMRAKQVMIDGVQVVLRAHVERLRLFLESLPPCHMCAEVEYVLRYCVCAMYGSEWTR